MASPFATFVVVCPCATHHASTCCMYIRVFLAVAFCDAHIGVTQASTSAVVMESTRTFPMRG